MKNNNIHEIFESQYRHALEKATAEGVHRYDRTGVGCKSIFGVTLEADVSKYFPILTGKAMFPKTFNTEFLWFINGETNIKRFQDKGVSIWDAWADENGDLGPVYGHQMLNYNDQGVNQLENLIEALKMNPDSRRHIILLWNPVQIDKMALPPCYLYFQFFVEGENLSMFALQRSGDLFLGVPYDMALFTMILNYVAAAVGLKPKTVKMEVVDAHIYDNATEQVKTYIARPLFHQPTYRFVDDQIILADYKRGKSIKCSVAV